MKKNNVRPSKVIIIGYGLVYILSLIWQTNEFVGFTFGMLAFTDLNELLVLKQRLTLAKWSFLLPLLMLSITYMRVGLTKNFYLSLVLVLLAMAVRYFSYRKEIQE